MKKNSRRLVVIVVGLLVSVGISSSMIKNSFSITTEDRVSGSSSTPIDLETMDIVSQEEAEKFEGYTFPDDKDKANIAMPDKAAPAEIFNSAKEMKEYYTNKAAYNGQFLYNAETN